MNKTLKEVLLHILIIAIFIGVSFIYFFPIIEGKVIRQMDVEHSVSIAHEATTYSKSEDRSIGWTNSLFSGMPTYQIGGIKTPPSVYKTFFHIFYTLPANTVTPFLIYLLGFYLLLISFKFNKWLSAIGALSFALASYNIIIIAAGHITKTYAIGLMPAVVAGFILIYNKKYWLGIIVALLALGIQIRTTHVQIVYYTGLLIGLYVIFNLIWAIKDKKIKDFSISSAIAMFIVVLALLGNTPSLWRANEMGKYSIRGESELTSTKTKTTGLDKDYALNWSYGIGETFSLLVPNVKGVGSGQIGQSKIAMSKVNGQYKDFVAQLDSYWGDQPFTSGPVYFGAIILFLSILGMFIVKDKIKWWLFASAILSITLSWGKNFEILTDLFFFHFPYYNKFRAVSTILVVANFSITFMAFLAVKEFLTNKEIIKKNIKYFWIAFGLTGGLALIFWLLPNIFSFSGISDIQVTEYLKAQKAPQNIINEIFSSVESARIAVFRADAIRSFLYIAIFSGLLLLYTYSKKITKTAFVAILGILILSDMWTIDRRFLSKDDFVPKKEERTKFTPSLVNTFINKDTNKDYRVLNIGVSTFNDAFTSYFHRSIGGYQGAKLHRYQDIIDRYLQQYVSILRNSLRDTTISPYDLLPQMSILNMLNAKYIIYSPQETPLINTNTYGAAWFVDKLKFVQTPDEEISTIGNENLRRTAVINKNKFDVSKLSEVGFQNDTTRQVQLTKYIPDNLLYTINSKKGGFVVFSEVYYPKGWIATIDGTPTPIYQTNYILRGIQVPAGKHEIKFEFKPKAIYLSTKIQNFASVIILIVILVSITMLFLQKKKLDKNTLKE